MSDLVQVDIQSGTRLQPPASSTSPSCKPVVVTSLTQLEANLILIAWEKTIRFVNVAGHEAALPGCHTQLTYEHDIKSAICLPGKIY